jgi:hypothetical protein
MAELGDLFSAEGHAAIAVIDQHEVIPRAIHFGELNLHGKRLVEKRHQFNRGRNWAIASRS